ncbi:hypothetical protein [Chryseobacterium sp. ON_d1]|uniref:hypothetical protein n=1 Tax=Chryseobacterium sp. ON_d1 TaxID=2583211 RepID=UPI0011580C43|nr:hypothetical protein [Chryseobacterium sp. ON_d1]GEJ46044.1 hypothetical protein CRS_26520 [Chryseobacterium sp. ON_d1]
MKTKYIKVSVSERIPEKEGDYFCVIANGPSIMTCRSMYFERFKGITHWLEEKPDYEDEMKEILEEVFNYSKAWPLDGLPSQMEDKIEELLTKLKTKES